MALLSLPAVPPASPSFGATAPPTHTRRHSRNPSAAPLPAFSFNPGVADQNTPPMDLDAQPPSKDIMTEKGHVRRTSKPPPLPSFSFNPGAELPVEHSPSPTHPVLEEMAMNQQRVSRSARPAPLPIFTFNPNASSIQPIPSPTRSEPGEDVQRAVVGHRRRGSEFVGGAQMVSTSPQRHEQNPAGPPLSAGGMRGGHAHRRSQAVSISDIDTSDLIKAHALAKHRAESGPSTPSEGVQTFSFARPSPQARQSVSFGARSPPGSPRRRGSAPGVRPRVVEFADKIDVIPRPLSMISSETEGSTSTIRGNHSVSNSLNSIASPLQTSPHRLSMTMSSPVLEEPVTRRPNTADAATLLSTRSQDGDRSLSVISLPKRPLSASGSPAITLSGSPPTKKKHFWFSHSSETSPTPTPKAEHVNPVEKLPEFAPANILDQVRPKTSPELSATLKRRKYHTWTAGIFSKKARQRSSKQKGKRAPTPPSMVRRDSDKVNEIFDADDTVVLREDSPAGHRKLPPVASNTFVASSYSAPEEHIPSPVVDLDAALGPFGSEEKFGSESATKNSVPRISRLHSSERRGVVDAFGSVHRRTESAPSMPAVNRSLFGMHRHGSNASLSEDVFDEEEEDMFLADQKNGKSGRQDLAQQASRSLPGKFEQLSACPPSASAEGLGLSNMHKVTNAVVIVDVEDETASEDPRSSKSTIQAPMFEADDMPKRPATSPMAFAYPSTQSHYASSTEGQTTTASLISSPDVENVSFDNPPRFTRIGEASPDFLLRPSTDDLQSLSDSISSGAVPRVSSSANTRSSTDQRSASMFVPTTSRSNQTWKRSSLASLNRLLPGSSNGSKLKFETVPDLAGEEKSDKRKSNRISKLMYFWRSKEKIEQ